MATIIFFSLVHTTLMARILQNSCSQTKENQKKEIIITVISLSILMDLIFDTQKKTTLFQAFNMLVGVIAIHQLNIDIFMHCFKLVKRELNFQ